MCDIDEGRVSLLDPGFSMLLRTYQEVVLCVFEHHINALVLEDDLTQCNEVLASATVCLAISGLVDHDTEFPIERDLSDGRLRNARIGRSFAFFVWFELLDGIEQWFRRIGRIERGRGSLLDLRLVNSAVSSCR